MFITEDIYSRGTKSDGTRPGDGARPGMSMDKRNQNKQVKLKTYFE